MYDTHGFQAVARSDGKLNSVPEEGGGVGVLPVPEEEVLFEQPAVPILSTRQAPRNRQDHEVEYVIGSPIRGISFAALT